MRIRAILSPILLAGALAGGVHASEAPAGLATGDDRPLIQLAILLDTSSSMDGLIDQARARIWAIVDELATARRAGKSPHLEVALYEYGNTGLAASDNWIRQVLPLTDDLDEVSKQLFALRTSGGEEYCGAVIDQAVHHLAWSAASGDLKEILIAGNEPFTQGPIDPIAACRAAIAAGVIVNTIHCGSDADGRAGKWDEGARAADGAYLTIDQDQMAAVPAAPQDDELAKLNQALNATYLAYGAAGAECVVKQTEQDANAAASGSFASRACAKASGLYSNSRWDLVDAVEEKKVDVATLPDDQLPEALRGLTADQRAAKVAEAKAERGRVTARIGELGAQRAAWLAEQRKDAGAKTLDEAALQALRAQAQAKQYQFAR